MSQLPPRQRDLKTLIETVGFEAIGQRVRRIRNRSNLTIRDLAEKAQVSKNTLLSLEQGNPTHISTIKVICKALKMKPEELTGPEFVQPSVVSLHHVEDSMWFDMNTFNMGEENNPLSPEQRSEAAVTPFCHLQSKFPNNKFNPHVVELHNPTPVRSHRGEEFVYVLSGSVRINVGTQSFDLKEGESICFWAAESHNYEPLSEFGTVKLLSIILDPFPKLGK